jgi:hypothetical protein
LFPLSLSNKRLLPGPLNYSSLLPDGTFARNRLQATGVCSDWLSVALYQIMVFRPRFAQLAASFCWAYALVLEMEAVLSRNVSGLVFNNTALHPRE